MDALQPGDTVKVTHADRLGRRTADLQRATGMLRERDVRLVVLNQATDGELAELRDLMAAALGTDDSSEEAEQ